MKKILRIARLELSIMFYSPIAWLVLILFIIQSGVVYAEMLYDWETRQQLARALPPMSKALFAGEDGVLAKIQRNLYLYIPILTMGLMSRETSSGSIKLLYSSPVTVFQIVLGKYLSMVCYAFLLCLILATYIITGTYSIVSLDITFVLGGILGIFLLICAYSAIGLFMSSLTNYQVVAAVSTLAVLAILNFIGGIGQQYDFVRDVTYWFSIAGRADNMVNGLIISKDIIYFVLVVVMFIGFSVLKLNDERVLRSGVAKWSRYAVLILGVTTIGYLSSRPMFTAYYDSTRFKDRTLTKNSIELIEELKEPITITTYVNLLHYSAKQGSPLNRIKDLQHFDQYQRFIPKMEMPYIAYYDTLPYKTDTTKTLIQKAKTAASAYKFDFDEVLSPKEIREKIDLIPEHNRLVRMLSYKGKQTPLRMFDDLFVYPKENEISVAIKRLLYGPSKIGFVNAHGERKTSSMENSGYQIFTNGTNIRGSMINQGFETKVINLGEVDALPEDLKVLVIADPQDSYTEKEYELLYKYIASGKNLLIAVEPDSEGLNSILDTLGIALKPGILLEESDDYEADLIQAQYTKETSDIGIRYRDNFIVSMPTAAGLIVKDSTKGFHIKTLLETNLKKVWNKTDDFNLEKEQVTYDPKTDTKEELPLAVALTRTVDGKDQKIVVLSDADFLSNVEMVRNNLNTRNPAFAMGLFKWLNDGVYPFSSPRPGAIDNKIKVDRTGILWIKIIYMGLFPGLLACLGLVILIRRKRN